MPSYQVYCTTHDCKNPAIYKIAARWSDGITGELKKGSEVRLVGFGTFAVTNRAASEGRNPRTGEKIQIAASKLPKFRAGKQLKDAVQ